MVGTTAKHLRAKVLFYQTLFIHYFFSGSLFENNLKKIKVKSFSRELYYFCDFGNKGYSNLERKIY